jgi:hypothetical protein
MKPNNVLWLQILGKNYAWNKLRKEKPIESGETWEYTVPLIKAPFMLDTVVLMSERWQSPSRYSSRGLVLLRHWMTEFMKHCTAKKQHITTDVPHVWVYPLT